MFGMSGRHVHALGNLMLPEISEHGVKVMSSNLLLQNETDPVLWRGPVIAGASGNSGARPRGPIDYLLVDMLRERVTSRSPFSNRCPSMASSSSRARKTWSR